MAAEYNATVSGRVEVAPGLIILRVTPDTLPFEFKAGQYVVLGVKASVPRVDEAEGESEPSVVAGARSASPRSAAIAASAAAVITGTAESQAAVDVQAAAVAGAAADPGRMIRRAYSIASESRAEEYLEFYLTLVMSGELTPRLFSLKLRDRVYVGPKAVGVFTLGKVAPGKHVLMIGTGTGLAPYMSMLRSELVCNGPRQFVVVHGARFSWDLGYRTELTGLARHCRNFHYMPIITRPQEDVTWRGRSGYLQNVVASGAIEEEMGLPLTPENFDIFLCGNPGMIETVIGWAEQRGFVRDKGHDIGTLHTEEYW
ncbi:MAG: ferredoxin--NADP reductase [Candidatus Limnocylindrales bacterium]|jgi:ferredoxin--NADP+ reductase